MIIYKCPKCGSENVEMLLAGFFPANGDWGSDQTSELSLAELYPDIYWCNDCEDHPSHLVEIEDVA